MIPENLKRAQIMMTREAFAFSPAIDPVLDKLIEVCGKERAKQMEMYAVKYCDDGPNTYRFVQWGHVFSKRYYNSLEEDGFTLIGDHKRHAR